MGVGKSMLGRRLSGTMGLDFIDLDQEIEKEQGLTVSGIFERDGEDEFRKTERRQLKESIERDNFIMACGGGTPCYRDNMDIMNGAGKTLLLDLPQDVIYKRLLNSKQQRPLVTNMGPGELKAYISDKIAERKPFYDKAKIKIDPLNTSLELISKILGA